MYSRSSTVPFPVTPFYDQINQTIFLSDIDECATSNGGCEHTCVNTYESFYCVCRQGYTLSADSQNCEGECLFIIEECDHKRLYQYLYLLLLSLTRVEKNFGFWRF